MTRKLQYIVHNRPDIALALEIVARFSANPKENLMIVMKRVMRYLKGTKDYGLYYKRSDRFELKVFNDFDRVGNIDYRKSTSGGAVFLGKRLVSWKRKKHNCIFQSIAEVEYVVVVVHCSNIMWIKKLFKGMQEVITDLVVSYSDNTSTINISKNQVMHIMKKHIAIKYQYLRELVQDKEVKLEYVNTKEYIADIFTKPLPKDTHEYLRGKLWVIPVTQAT